MTIRKSSRFALAALPWFLALGLGLFAPAAPAYAQSDSQEVEASDLEAGMDVKITKVDGGVVEGKVEEVSTHFVKVKTSFGVISVRRDDIQTVSRFRPFDERYKERSKSCKTVDEWLALADWCEREGRGDFAKKALDEAVELEPDNEKLRERRGEKKLDGEWIPESEWYEKNGYEWFRGKWRKQEEIDSILAKEKNRDSDAVAKDREALEREYAGLAWADVEPVETPHYWILSNSVPEVTQRYADILEQLYKKYDRTFPEKYFPRQGTGRKSRVYIHANYDQFLALTGMQRGVGGFFRPAEPLRDVTAYHGSFGTSGSTPEVLAHEGTHQFQCLIWKNMSAVPAWTVEGMACYFGDGTEITRREITLNVIPRSRLIGLQAAIENGSYCELDRLMMIPQPQFGGFFYGHGWGIFYWCWHEFEKFPTGIEIMNDWMLYCRDLEDLNLQRSADEFRSILTAKTGKSVADWEEEYKQFILDLTVPTVVSASAAGWESEKLKCSGKKVPGWRRIPEVKLSDAMPIAYGITANSARRIGTIISANWQKAPLDVDTVKQNLLNTRFSDIEYLEGGEPKLAKTHGFDTVVTTFKGREIEGESRTVGSDDSGSANAEHLYRLVFYRTADRFYCNMQRASGDDMETFEKDFEKFDKYLDGFQIDFTGG